MTTRSAAMLLSALALTGAGACQKITYQFEVPAGSELVLGGPDSSRFGAEITNLGPGTLEIAEFEPSGARRPLAVLPAESASSEHVSRRHGVSFANRSEQPATVSVAVHGRPSLGLPYEPSGDTGPSSR